MRRCCGMKRNRMIARLFAGAVLAILVVPLAAQSRGDSQRGYDHAKETKLTGTVSAVINGTRSGTNLGSYFVLTTLSGSVDVSLGRWGFHGKDAPSIMVGHQVELVGVMKTFNNKKVFLARTLNVGGKVYTILNERGIPTSPHSRERFAQKGGSL